MASAAFANDGCAPEKERLVASYKDVAGFEQANGAPVAVFADDASRRVALALVRYMRAANEFSAGRGTAVTAVDLLAYDRLVDCWAEDELEPKTREMRVRFDAMYPPSRRAELRTMAEAFE